MRNKKIISIALCITAVFMAVGYAIFATNLRINGSVGITGKWLVHFTSITTGEKTTGASNNTDPTASGTTATMDANLELPGDSITYTLTLANDGNVNAIIGNVNAKAEGSNAIVFSIDGIKKGDKLAIGDSKTITIKIEYDENFTSQPEETSKILTVDIDCVQDVGQTITSEDTNISQPLRLATAILRDNNAQPDTDIDFSQISSDTNGKGLYYTSTNTEDNKVTYYFRGAVENNYVSFGDISGTCTYKGINVEFWDENDDFIDNPTITKESCQSTNVCLEYQDNELMYAKVGLTEASCIAFNDDEDFTNNGGKAVWANEKATFDSRIKWRIVRINEDGSIRLIKQDSIGNSVFNENYEDAAYVGYMYGTAGSTTYEATHSNTNSSSIKTMLDTWYQNNLTSYSSIIADSGFCGDRSLSSGTGIGTTSTDYGARRRLESNKTPQFKCPQSNDLYTTTTSTKGNKALTYPIGLVTADEVAYAGGVAYEVNEEYYLTNGDFFRTMSPAYSVSNAGVWLVSPGGDLGDGTVRSVGGVRPAINLKSTAEIIDGGNGTLNNPYVIKTN